MASWVALGAVGGGLLVYAIGSEGQTTHHADLNDGGVWVTNQSLDMIARQNKPIQQLDAMVPGGPQGVGDDADVLQDGIAVVSVVGTQLTPVDAAGGKAVVNGTVEAAGLPSLAGRTLATVDPADGRVRATRIAKDEGVSGLDALTKDAKPLFAVGSDAIGTVTRGGAVIAVSGAGDAKMMRPSGTGFTDTEDVELAKPSGGVAQVTAVGDTPVVLDKDGRVLVGDHVAEVADGAAVAARTVQLQQPGPDADEVLVATDGGLQAVSLDDGSVRKVSDGSGSQVVAPVVVGECGFAVWADGTAASVVAACDGKDPQGPTGFEVGSDSDLVFRVNRNQVVLNDVKDGSVWSVDAAKPVQIANWDAYQPHRKNDQDDDDKTDDRQVRRAPQANPDTLGVRAADTATVLHVLDNDKVSGGGVLTITKVGKPNKEGVDVKISPDRQTVIATLPQGFTGNPTFSYTIDDGSGGKDATDDGLVTIRTRSPNEAAVAPTRIDNVKDVVVPIAASGNAEVSVLGEWRDKVNGDPVSVDITGLKPDKDLDASATSDGLIRIRPAGRVGMAKVQYTVSTGGPAETGTVRVRVLDRKSREVLSPKAQPDVVSGEVGGTITFSPLDNDIPGADPSEPTATLELAANVATTPGLTVETDRQSGKVTIRPKRADRFELSYSVGYGAARRVSGKIYVVATPASPDSDQPVAAPDTATVYGTSPVVIDALANDYDPKGRVLSVLSAEPTVADSGLQVAVIDGRWLRVNALSPDLVPQTQAVTYTVSNGVATDSSRVAVTQKDPLPANDNIPITTDDDVVVRAGDAVLVPVLDNDSTPSGDPIGLATLATDGVPSGELSIDRGLGRAFVSGRNVRYVAPAGSEIESPTTVEITYVAQNTSDLTIPQASGVLRVQITPPSCKEPANQIPTPRGVEGRVTQGDEVTLRLPLVGNDPDGDSVSVVGIEQAPRLGRLLSVGANAMVYQAFPGSAGTDEFRFVVQDACGDTAVGTARVAVTPAGAPQQPVAVNDVVTAEPGRNLQIDVLANDFRTPGTALRLLDLDEQIEGVEPDLKTGLIKATAPEDPRKPLVAAYRVSSGLDESSAVLQVRSEKGYNNPPVVEDAYAELEDDADKVVVDVLASAYDIDGEGEPVLLDAVGSDSATFDKDDADGKVTLRVLKTPQVVPFRVMDGQGGTASAVIYVPAQRVDVPYLRKEYRTDGIQIDPGETKDLKVEDLVSDPEGDKVFLTIVENIAAAPAELLSARAPDNENLSVSATKEARGPGALTFEVSDKPGIDDPDRHVAVLTVPVTIGDGSPLVSCPRATIPVVEGGASKALDIATICHVWTPRPAAAGGLDYSADWADGQAIDDVEVDNTDAGVELTAAVGARSQATGVLEVSVEGKPAVDATGERATLLVKVVKAGPPSLNAIPLEGEAGKTVTVDVASYGRSPFGSRADWVMLGKPVQMPGGPAPARISSSGTKVSLTPPEGEHGQYTFRVSLADNGETSGERRADGLVRLSVVSAPEQVTGLRTDGQVYDSAVKLLWTPPNAGGGAIRGYTVNFDGGKTTCPSSRCTITGLENAHEYTFTVVAHNQYGDSEPSKAVKGTPDRVPDQVVGLKVVEQRDKQVLLEWSAPDGNFSAIEDYNVSWPGSGSIRSTHGKTSFPAPVSANGEPTTFSVWAVNSKGPGPKSPVTGEGAGKPDAPVLDKPGLTNAADQNQKAVTISWSAVPPNGPGPTEYYVTKDGSKQVCPGSGWTQAISCPDALPNDGTTTSYTVRARNAEATAGRGTESNYVSADSSPVSVEAAAPPEGVSNLKAVATGNDGQARVTFDVGPSHGKTNQINCTPSCGNLQATSVDNAGRSGLSFDLPGLSNGSTTTVTIWTCNGSSGSEQTGSACSGKTSDTTVTYGPLSNPGISVSGSGQCLYPSASGNGNGKDARLVLYENGSVIDSTGWSRGPLSLSPNRCLGYSQSRSYRVELQDSGETAEQPNNRADRAAGPVSATTDPPPRKVTVGKTGNAQGMPGCASASCAYLQVTLENFSGSVRCSAHQNNPNDTDWTNTYVLG
ncbi:Ig-like domain-containing protein, partial [Nocardioides sp. Root79]|uniref:Ig-like domain-containing protein n=1 Tax=Nocardioides sp. Root79 TaxID=1736600 RepID=UPI001CEC1604